MIFLVFSDYFQVQTFRWFCLPSKLVICHVCIRATSRIKSSNWELHIRYRSKLPQKSQDQPQPLLLSQTIPDNLAREGPRGPVRLQTGWKYHAVPKLMPKLSQERIFATFASLLSTAVQYTAVAQASSSRRQGAGPSLSDWSDTISNMIVAENEKMTADCCSISTWPGNVLNRSLPNVSKICSYSRIQFPDSAVKMFWFGNHNNSKLQVKFYNRYNITMHQTIISFVNSGYKLRNEFQEGVRWM